MSLLATGNIGVGYWIDPGKDGASAEHVIYVPVFPEVTAKNEFFIGPD